MPVAPVTASASAITEAAPLKSPLHVTRDALALQRGGELGERSGLTRQLQLAGDDRVPALQVPERGGGGRCHRPELEHLLIVAKRNDRLPQRRRRRSEPRRDQLGEAVEEEIGRVRLVRGRRSGADCARDLAERAGTHKLARSQGRAPRLEIGLAREVDVERLEQPRRLQQLRSGTAEACARRDPPAQKLDASPLKLVQGPRFGCREYPERRVESTRLEARLCRGERALRAPNRVGGQRNGALQKRRRRGDPAAGLSPARRQLELEGNLLVRCERCMSPMPGAAIRIARGIDGLCQRLMHVATPVGGRSTVDRRPE